MEPLANPNHMMRMPPPMNSAPFAQAPFPPKQHTSSLMNPALVNEQDEKKKEFARGIFISGFEKTVTTEMIQKHFSIKTIFGLRHPVTKFKESKGFAFIYYGSEDEALYVKKTLDRTAILNSKIRITRIVISENISKMMIKLKTHGLAQKEIQENETRYFNDENLEKQVQRIVRPLFGTSVEVNKINIPHNKKDKKNLRYARVFFYVSDLKEGSRIASSALGNIEGEPENNKNEYEKILSCINGLLRNDAQFNRYCYSEIYEYTKKNQSNVLHIKGIKMNPKEDPNALSEEIKEFFQKQNPQWNILNVYAANFGQMGSWANVTFATYEETIQAYDLLKNTRPKFRDGLLYGSLRNVKDLRTVVISVVRKDATEKLVEKFLKELSERSTKNPTQPGEEPVRKYDYFSFNIVESKTFYKNDSNEIEGVDEGKNVEESWIIMNEVPRRLIIHFFNEFSDEDIKELTNDIKTSPGYEEIFLAGDSKKQLRSNHQKGHVNKDGTYTKHTEVRPKKKQRTQNVRGTQGRPPRGEMGGQMRKRNFDLKQFSFAGGMGGMPKYGMPGVGGMMLNSRPQVPSIGGMMGMGSLGLPGTFAPSSVPGLPTGSTNLPGTNISSTGQVQPQPPQLSGLPGMSMGLPGVGVPGMPRQPMAPSGPNMPIGGGMFKPPGFPPGMPGMPGMTGLPGMPGGIPGFPQQPINAGIPKPFPTQQPNLLGNLPKPQPK